MSRLLLEVILSMFEAIDFRGNVAIRDGTEKEIPNTARWLLGSDQRYEFASDPRVGMKPEALINSGRLSSHPMTPD